MPTEATWFLKNKLMRHIAWNGQEFEVFRYGRNEYGELDENIIESFKFKGLFHDGGGYGGMLNIEIYERDGARTMSKMKPMILCTYEDGVNITTDDWCMIGGDKFNVIDKNNVKQLGIMFEISLEKDNTIGNGED